MIFFSRILNIFASFSCLFFSPGDRLGKVAAVDDKGGENCVDDEVIIGGEALSPGLAFSSSTRALDLRSGLLAPSGWRRERGRLSVFLSQYWLFFGL